jgi:hypothetical protein
MLHGKIVGFLWVCPAIEPQTKSGTSGQLSVFGGICGRKNAEGGEEHRTRDSLWK